MHESSLYGTPREQFSIKGNTKRKIESNYVRKMGKVRVKLTDILPFVWYAKMKELYRHYRKRQRASRASEKASYIKRLRLLIRRLKGGHQNESIREISSNSSTRAIQEKTAALGNLQEDKDAGKSQLARADIGTIQEVDLPEKPLIWNMEATVRNKAVRKKVVLRKKEDGKIVSLRASLNPATKVEVGDIGYSNQSKTEVTSSDLCKYRLSVSSVDVSAEANDYDWDKDLASFASGSSFTRSLEEDSSVIKQTKQKPIEQSISTQTPGCVSQIEHFTEMKSLTNRQINALVDKENGNLITLPKAVTQKQSRGARRRAPQATGSERSRNLFSHTEVCNDMTDNGWCSSILESTSKGWIDVFSCSLKPFEKEVSHQRLSSSCATTNLSVRRRGWKSEEKLYDAFFPKLASVCGCAQRNPSWKETDSTEIFVKRNVTSRKKEVKSLNRRNKSTEGMVYINNEESLKPSKVKDSVPVVKCSFEPYEELRASMIEMIVNKKLHETQDLDELLRCYLALNPPSHHHLIVKTFKDVWQEILENSEH